VSVDCKRGEKLLDFFFAHLTWVALVMKENEPRDPVHVGLLRLVTVVADAEDVTNLLKQFRLVRVRRTDCAMTAINRGQRVG
jgi:hypothetical protein